MDVHNATLKARSHHLCLAIVGLVSWSLAVEYKDTLASALECACLGHVDLDLDLDKDAGRS